MWIVELRAEAEDELRDLLALELVTKADIKVLLRWVNEMEEFGPAFIATSFEWYDHELERDWKGFRSSAFCHSGRIIYKLDDKKKRVSVYRVTVVHDYKR